MSRKKNDNKMIQQLKLVRFTRELAHLKDLLDEINLFIL